LNLLRAAATISGLTLASRGQRTLVMSVDAAHSLAYVIGSQAGIVTVVSLPA